MAREQLFELAVNRAASYAARFGVLGSGDAAQLHRVLELWYLKTRFAYRVPFEAIVAALARYPPKGRYRWRGGPQGGWQADDA